MVSDKEYCARLLRKIWIRNGIIASSAFNLRPSIHETYISLLRESQPSFLKDLYAITKDNPIVVASLLSGKVRLLDINDNIKLDIKEVDNKKLHSHCGLYIYVDGKQVIGGEPFITKSGEPVDTFVLQVKLALARMASVNLKTIERK